RQIPGGVRKPDRLPARRRPESLIRLGIEEDGRADRVAAAPIGRVGRRDAPRGRRHRGDLNPLGPRPLILGERGEGPLRAEIAEAIRFKLHMPCVDGDPLPPQTPRLFFGVPADVLPKLTRAPYDAMAWAPGGVLVIEHLL